MEVDAGPGPEILVDYQDQRYGMLLTSSYAAASEYKRFRSGMVDVGQNHAFKATDGMSLSDYFNKYRA